MSLSGVNPARGPVRVVVAGLACDPQRRDPDTLLAGAWPGFGQPAAAAQRAGGCLTIVQAASHDAEREVNGVRCEFIRPDNAGGTARDARILRRIAELAPDVIHFEGLILPHRVRALARACTGIPILAQDHGTHCPRGVRRYWYRWGFAPLAGVAFTARTQAIPFVVAGIFSPGLPVFEIPEVSTGFIPGDKDAARARTGLEGDPCLLWAGNLDDNKDPLCVLDAVGLASSRLPELRLYMAFRHDPLRTRVEARLSGDPTLRSRVRLVGMVAHEQFEAFFQAADFFVQASHVESAGAAVIEALACGATPLVTDIPSFQRLTAEGTVGALVPVGDAPALAEAIVTWARRDRAALRQQARAWFERDLSYDAMGRQLRAAYETIRR